MPVLVREPRYSVLEFFESSSQFNHRKPYANGITKPLATPLGVIPPFQFVKLDGVNFSTAELVHYQTGAAYPVLTSMYMTGLEKTAYTGTGYYGTYWVWQYPGIIPLPYPGLPEGAYYLRLQDQNGVYILSDFFTFHDGLEFRKDYVRLEWWALNPMVLDKELVDGALKSTVHIQFNAPFKWYAYIRAHLIGGSWSYDELAEVRDGHDFELKITRFKDWRFEFPATEPFMDAISLVPLHDRIQVTYNGITLEKIARFRPEAEQIGNGIFGVTCTFRTQMTTNTVTAPGLTSTAYEVDPGSCLSPVQFCQAIIEAGTAEYAGGYATDEFGSNRNFSNGDYIIVETAGVLVVRQAVGGNSGVYNNVTEADYSNWWANLDGRPTGAGLGGEFYFFAYAGQLHDAPYLLAESISGTTWTVTGRTFGNSIVQVVLKDGDGNEWIGAVVDWITFPSPGVQFEVVENGKLATAYKFRASTWRCPNIAESEWYLLSGVEYDEIEATLEVYPEGNEPPAADDDE